MEKTKSSLSVVAVLVASAVLGADVISWKGSVTEGYLDDPEN